MFVTMGMEKIVLLGERMKAVVKIEGVVAFLETFQWRQMAR